MIVLNPTGGGILLETTTDVDVTASWMRVRNG